MMVRDVMTSGVETIGPDETVDAAARRMRDAGIGALVVRDDDGGALGMITDRDIVVRIVAEGRDPARATVHDAMTAQILECREDEEIDLAALRMEHGAVRRLVVHDAADRLVGMLSVDDVALRSPALAGEIVEHVRAPERPAARAAGPWPWWEDPSGSRPG